MPVIVQTRANSAACVRSSLFCYSYAASACAYLYAHTCDDALERSTLIPDKNQLAKQCYALPSARPTSLQVVCNPRSRLYLPAVFVVLAAHVAASYHPSYHSAIPHLVSTVATSSALHVKMSAHYLDFLANAPPLGGYHQLWQPPPRQWVGRSPSHQRHPDYNYDCNSSHEHVRHAAWVCYAGSIGPPLP